MPNKKLREVPESNTGLAKLPEDVRNKMGFMKVGGATKKTPTKKVMIKGADVSGLTKRQQKTMKKHSEHHTSKHMKSMTDMMNKGKTFSQAHKAAQKKVGS
tara:strand:- start:259 stop:561 length:303 start_codon:yes stop_codon:yes gene_type:complete